MRRIESCFQRLDGQNRKALIPFVTAGDPVKDVTVPLMHAMVDAGADIIELGVPFSDPMADGPVIQLACERALAHNTSTRDVLAMVKAFRETNTDTPVVLMGYLNPVEVMGYEAFAEAAADAGVDGVLLVDLPPEEALEVKPVMDAHGLDMIFLVAPTTSDARIKLIGEAGSGYLYYVSLKGVTGSATLNVDEVASRVETIRNLAQLPIGVGFGIKDAESAQAVSRVADGVVVGSALVNQIAENKDTPDAINDAVGGILSAMRNAMDQ
ncbi:tryptophan synthase subunit alpha [Alcanivorax sp. VBW004]|jgi:tryptophan synthase alpha chain|uniref:tryptophan synthase subunit alpha n=1 Tax=unclassified Alcanivorax TaxID=2638842 RepID=UPI00017ECFD0|nr:MULTISPECIES: tryptophan synthase subunit alpha [unclassified Alcanivorax]EDX89417.1 tryptophan synthase, alpha subunit [Alcanivorax sp. DG881]MTT53331.1 tryptophan synthase subunit alpha [Alcanivorax sp. VBW004]